MAERIVTCRMIDRWGRRCTGSWAIVGQSPTVAEDGEALICIRRYSAVIRTVHKAQANIAQRKDS